MLLALMTLPSTPAPPGVHAVVVASGSFSHEAAALRPLIRAIIASILREPSSHPDVEDGASETLRRALEKHDQIRDPGAVRPWVLGIARHVGLDAIRARKRARQHIEVAEGPSSSPDGAVELVDTGPNPLERVEQARRDRVVRQAIDSLPEGPRKALMMFHLEGLEYQEIARRLEVPLGTVATWVARGRKAMAVTLEEARDS